MPNLTEAQIQEVYEEGWKDRHKMYHHVRDGHLAKSWKASNAKNDPRNQKGEGEK